MRLPADRAAGQFEGYGLYRLSKKTLLGKGFVSGHDFSRAAEATKKHRALAPALFVFSYLQLRSG
jgi:hypothetical protein